VKIIKGDISDIQSLKAGMKGCDWVFHLAAFTGSWSKDPEIPFNVNVNGTINVLEASKVCGIKRVIFTSTCGTMGYSENGKVIDETTNTDPHLCTIYERTKAEAEKKALAYFRNGLDVVIVNPSRIYGPGLVTKGNSLTRIINLYIRGFWRIVPGTGKSVGNYVFIDDVVDGHIFAAFKGVPGERYILGGENLSFSKLFEIVGEAARKPRKMLYLPIGLMKTIANFMLIIPVIFQKPPLITREWLEKYNHDAVISSEKAIGQLGYRITPFSSGVKKTIDWLRSDNLKQ
jgi:nucleoside-diphosphate-sugar epimerase